MRVTIILEDTREGVDVKCEAVPNAVCASVGGSLSCHLASFLYLHMERLRKLSALRIDSIPQ